MVDANSAYVFYSSYTWHVLDVILAVEMFLLLIKCLTVLWLYDLFTMICMLLMLHSLLIVYTSTNCTLLQHNLQMVTYGSLVGMTSSSLHTVRFYISILKNFIHIRNLYTSKLYNVHFCDSTF